MSTFFFKTYFTLKKVLRNKDKLISIQANEHSLRILPNNDRVNREHLDEFLQRENNLIENLIQIYKQFIKLHASSEGHIQLNKKLCIIESFKCYVEHLMLFNKFDFILPPSMNLDDSKSRHNIYSYLIYNNGW